jgi:hypothetical protein
MKEYKDIPEKGESAVNEPSVAYQVVQPRQSLTPAPTFKIPRDVNGKPIGTPWEEVRNRLNIKLSEAYGVDFTKVSQLIDSGELHDNELTNELLLSSEFKYEPYPDFKPKPRSEYKPNPEWLVEMENEYDLINVFETPLE